MIFPAAGVPGRFAERCEILLRLLAGGESAAFVQGNTLEELGANLLATDRDRAVTVARQPGVNLAAALKQGTRPFLVALEPAQGCVAALMQDHGLNLLDAVRQTASAGAAMLPLLDSGSGLVLWEKDCESLAALAQRMARHFGLAGSEAALAQIAALPPPAPLRPVPSLPAQADFAPFDDDVNAMLPDLLTGALAPVWKRLEGGGMQEILWHRDLFLNVHDGSTAAPPAVMDVTGPARCLFFGPYIHLPPGSWSCSLTLGCSLQAAGLKLIAEVAARDVLTAVSFEVTEPGFFEITFSFTLPTTDHPVEIRLLNPAAAFEGHLALVRATMTPLKASRIPVKPIQRSP
jgi:hypothetical protein